MAVLKSINKKSHMKRGQKMTYYTTYYGNGYGITNDDTAYRMRTEPKTTAPKQTAFEAYEKANEENEKYFGAKACRNW
jgi:hypothetical protein